MIWKRDVSVKGENSNFQETACNLQCFKGNSTKWKYQTISVGFSLPWNFFDEFSKQNFFAKFSKIFQNIICEKREKSNFFFCDLSKSRDFPGNEFWKISGLRSKLQLIWDLVSFYLWEILIALPKMSGILHTLDIILVFRMQKKKVFLFPFHPIEFSNIAKNIPNFESDSFSQQESSWIQQCTKCLKGIFVFQLLSFE